MSILDRLKRSKVEIKTNIDGNHVLILFDTTDSTFFKNAKNYAQIYLGNNVLPGNVRVSKATLENLAKYLEDHNSKDKLIIHYVGHGVNLGGQFPHLQFEDGICDVINILREFERNMLLILDCCNNLPHGSLTQMSQSYSGVDILFNLEGFNVIVAAKRGLKSWYYTDKATVFFEAFSSVVSSPQTNIKEFLEQLNSTLVNIYQEKGLFVRDDGVIIDYEIKGTGQITPAPILRAKSDDSVSRVMSHNPFPSIPDTPDGNIVDAIESPLGKANVTPKTRAYFTVGTRSSKRKIEVESDSQPIKSPHEPKLNVEN